MSQPDIRRTRLMAFFSALMRSPVGLSHLFCGVTAAIWLILLAVTFTDRSLVIFAATLVWLCVAGLTLLLLVSLSRKRISRKTLVLIATSWILGTLWVSNWAVGYWQSRQRLWSGFVFDARYGWYPEANLKQRTLLIPNGTYLASTDELGHRNPLPYPDDHALPAILQGDSNAFGFGLAEDETLSAVLNAKRPKLAATVFSVMTPERSAAL